jgi:hypothetical protein
MRGKNTGGWGLPQEAWSGGGSHGLLCRELDSHHASDRRYKGGRAASHCDINKTWRKLGGKMFYLVGGKGCRWGEKRGMGCGQSKAADADDGVDVIKRTPSDPGPSFSKAPRYSPALSPSLTPYPASQAPPTVCAMLPKDFP